MMRHRTRQLIPLVVGVLLAASVAEAGTRACRAHEVIESSTGRWEGKEVTVTIKTVDHDSKTEEFLGEPKEWKGVVADLEVCAGNRAIVLDRNFRMCEEYEFVVDEESEPYKDYGESLPQDVQFREPVFVQWDEIPAGECRSGWLTFVETWAGPPEEGPKLFGIVFEATAENGDVERVVWRLE